MDVTSSIIMFSGVFAYADDVVILSPDRTGLQMMLNITKSHLDYLGLSISVNFINPKKSKTKTVAFGRTDDPATIKLDGVPLPWCDSFVHLGHLLHRSGSPLHDCELRRRSFIGEYNTLVQVLHNKDPIVYMKLIQIYMTHFYGSNLWNLFSPSVEKLFTTWNNMIRTIFKVPRMTHRCLIEVISGSMHLKTLLVNRFLKFYHSLSASVKPIINKLKSTQETCAN